MKITDKVEMLEIDGMGRVYLTLAWDDNSLVLADAGFPGQTEAIVKAVTSAGHAAEKITHIILTHQDMDHIGCVRDLLKLAPNAKVLAHADEAPYIDGSKTPIKLAALLAQYDSLPADRKAWCDRIKNGLPNLTVTVNQLLRDGDVLPICGGIEVIHTPGHTPGHICLYLQKEKVLVTGDALNIQDGKLTGPNPQHTFNMELGLQSAEKAKKFPFDKVISHHGGFLKVNLPMASCEIFCLPHKAE